MKVFGRSIESLFRIWSVLEMFLSYYFNPLSANPTKWSNTLKQFVGKTQTNCLNVLTFCRVAVQRVKLHDGKILSILKLL